MQINKVLLDCFSTTKLKLIHQHPFPSPNNDSLGGEQINHTIVLHTITRNNYTFRVAKKKRWKIALKHFKCHCRRGSRLMAISTLCHDTPGLSTFVRRRNETAIVHRRTRRDTSDTVDDNHRDTGSRGRQEQRHQPWIEEKSTRRRVEFTGGGKPLQGRGGGLGWLAGCPLQQPDGWQAFVCDRRRL